MRNNFKTTITLERKDVCDLMLACICAKRCATDKGEKWLRLHEKLEDQLDELDKQLDEIIKDAVEIL